MPTNETHRRFGYYFSIIFSFAIVILFYYLNKFPKSLIGWHLMLVPLVIYCYSNFPDIDHHISRFRTNTFKLVGLFLGSSVIFYALLDSDVFLIILSAVGIFLSVILRLPHRGPAHHYIFCLIISFPLLMIHWYLFFIGVVASGSHIFIDRTNSYLKRHSELYRSITNQKTLTDKYYMIPK